MTGLEFNINHLPNYDLDHTKAFKKVGDKLILVGNSDVWGMQCCFLVSEHAQ